jgi:hypothetical protein
MTRETVTTTPPRKVSSLSSKRKIGTPHWPCRATTRADIFTFIETFCAC